MKNYLENFFNTEKSREKRASMRAGVRGEDHTGEREEEEEKNCHMCEMLTQET
jgi:hypothetical protein